MTKKRELYMYKKKKERYESRLRTPGLALFDTVSLCFDISYFLSLLLFFIRKMRHSSRNNVYIFQGREGLCCLKLSRKFELEIFFLNCCDYNHFELADRWQLSTLHVLVYKWKYLGFTCVINQIPLFEISANTKIDRTLHHYHSFNLNSIQCKLSKSVITNYVDRIGHLMALDCLDTCCFLNRLLHRVLPLLESKSCRFAVALSPT